MVFSGFSPWFMRFWWLQQHTTAISAISIPYVQDMPRHGGAGTGDHWAPSCSGVEPTKPTSADEPGVWHKTIRTKLKHTNKHVFLMVFNHFIIFDGFWFLVFESVGFKGLVDFCLFFWVASSRGKISTVSLHQRPLWASWVESSSWVQGGEKAIHYDLYFFFLGRVLLESYWSV